MPAFSKFPKELHNLLESGYGSDLIHWSADGTSFAIENRDKFAKTLMPQFFPTMGSFFTFKRQLTDHQFKNLADGRGKRTEYSEWGHARFLRGKPELVVSIVRKHRDRKNEKRYRKGSSSATPTDSPSGSGRRHTGKKRARDAEDASDDNDDDNSDTDGSSGDDTDSSGSPSDSGFISAPRKRRHKLPRAATLTRNAHGTDSDIEGSDDSANTSLAHGTPRACRRGRRHNPRRHNPGTTPSRDHDNHRQQQRTRSCSVSTGAPVPHAAWPVDPSLIPNLSSPIQSDITAPSSDAMALLPNLSQFAPVPVPYPLPGLNHSISSPFHTPAHRTSVLTTPQHQKHLVDQAISSAIRVLQPACIMQFPTPPHHSLLSSSPLSMILPLAALTPAAPLRAAKAEASHLTPVTSPFMANVDVLNASGRPVFDMFTVHDLSMTPPEASHSPSPANGNPFAITAAKGSDPDSNPCIGGAQLGDLLRANNKAYVAKTRSIKLEFGALYSGEAFDIIELPVSSREGSSNRSSSNYTSFLLRLPPSPLDSYTSSRSSNHSHPVEPESLELVPVDQPDK
ncbi:hypothetical protein GQ42DRAFT_165200 [Ramicandelaber brevisporus]|nr:hypothetical protein GQ42DRAFT_165200 [Ramicandelaber brevisporus]